MLVGWLCVSGPHSGEAAGFPCENAKTPLELDICNAPELSKADEELNQTYRLLGSKLSASGKAILRRTERQWLNSIRYLCERETKGIDVPACLVKDFRGRKESLTAAYSSYAPFVVLYDIKDSCKVNAKAACPLPSLTGSWPVIDGPEHVRNRFANEVISKVCTDAKGDRGYDRFYRCELSYLNEHLLSFRYLAGHGPVELKGYREAASYFGRDHSFSLDHERQLEPGDIFSDDRGWQDLILNACRELMAKLPNDDLLATGDDLSLPPQDILNISSWLFDRKGVNVACSDRHSENLGPPSVSVGWAELRPYLVKGVIDPSGR